MGKSVNNEIMLITYADCMGNDLNDLENVLNKYLEGAVPIISRQRFCANYL